MSPAIAILAAVFLPLAGAAVISVTGGWPNLREAVTLVTAVTLFLVPGSCAYALC